MMKMAIMPHTFMHAPLLPSPCIISVLEMASAFGRCSKVYDLPSVYMVQLSIPPIRTDVDSVVEFSIHFIL